MRSRHGRCGCRQPRCGSGPGCLMRLNVDIPTHANQCRVDVDRVHQGACRALVDTWPLTRSIAVETPEQRGRARSTEAGLSALLEAVYAYFIEMLQGHESSGRPLSPRER